LNATIIFNPEHEIFKGHFPDQPVVPGVCMVQMVKEFMELATEQQLLFHKGHQIKFLQLIVPEKTAVVQVNISWKKENDAYLTTADFKKENLPVFKLSGVFTTNPSL